MPDLRLTVEGDTARVELRTGSARAFAKELGGSVESPQPDVLTFDAAQIAAFVGVARDLGLSFEATQAYFAAKLQLSGERQAASRAAVRRQSRDALAAAFGRRR